MAAALGLAAPPAGPTTFTAPAAAPKTPSGLVVSEPRCGPTVRFCSRRLPWLLRACSGRREVILGSGPQLLMQALAETSGLAAPPSSLPGHMACAVVMPLRLGILSCTSAMFWLDSVKSSGTMCPRLSKKAVTAYTSSAFSDLGRSHGMARLM